MSALFEVEPTAGAGKYRAASARSMRSRQRNGLRYGPAENDIRSTPRSLFAQLNAEFGFTLDVAAAEDNALCQRYFTEADNGLAQPWAPERCWMNPPYSHIEPWTQKAVHEAAAGALVVALLPVRTDLAWFHRDVLLAQAEIRFIRGRLRFGRPFGAQRWSTAPHPSMLVIWT